MKITNKQMFKLMEIIGIIGIDVELKGDASQMGTTLINTLLANAYKAQDQIEELIGELTGEVVDNPIKLLKAVTKLKNDKEVVNFFTEALETLI